MALYTAGLPGLALAAMLWLTISEPKRGAMAETFTPEPIGPTLGFLASQRTFVILLAGFCLTTYTNYATSAWIPPFLARAHHLSSAEIGTYAGTFKGLCGIAGTLLGGFVVAQIGRRDDRWKLWAPAITSGLAGPVFALCMLTSDFTTMVAALAATSFLVGFHLGPIFAIAQTVAKPSMRALASAIMLLTAAGFGQGVGPLAVGMLRRAEERFWRPGRAVFAAVGCSDDHAWSPVVHLGGTVDPGRYPAGELIRPARRRLSPCFYYCFDPDPRPAARIVVGYAICM
jgi:predicted MFS family arabinose efflux permease